MFCPAGVKVKGTVMQTIRHIYEHAPGVVPLPPKFRNTMVEVLFIQLEKTHPVTPICSDPVSDLLARLKNLVPVTLSALSLDTSTLHFDREELNAR
jgi:hypothetical protein